VRDAERCCTRLERAALGSLTDELETRLWEAPEDIDRRVDEHVVAFELAQVCDDRDLAQRGAGRLRNIGRNIQPVRDYGDLSDRHAFVSQSLCRCL
jgi:hypothetical protein